MKFLVDRCAGRRLADWLRDTGHDVVETRERGPDPGDRTILKWSATEERILVTMDKDFGQFIFSEAADHFGIVRLPDVPATRRILLMERVLDLHSVELQAKAVVTVRGGRIRISRAP